MKMKVKLIEREKKKKVQNKRLMSCQVSVDIWFKLINFSKRNKR